MNYEEYLNATKNPQSQHKLLDSSKQFGNNTMNNKRKSSEEVYSNVTKLKNIKADHKEDQYDLEGKG